MVEGVASNTVCRSTQPSFFFLYFRHSTELLLYRLAYAYVTLYILVRACETTQFYFEGEQHETSLFQP